MKLLNTLVILLILGACQNTKDTNEALTHFDKEIANRMETLNSQVISGDSLKPKINLIHEEVTHLILLSKDIENINASVMRANSFFDALAAEFRINLSDFTKLNTGMHVNEIELILKQNELNLYNQLIFKQNASPNSMYTAQ